MAAILDKRVKPSMVFRRGEGYLERIVREVRENEVSVYDFDGKWSASYGYGWFETGTFEFIRQMGDREFKKLMKAA